MTDTRYTALNPPEQEPPDRLRRGDVVAVHGEVLRFESFERGDSADPHYLAVEGRPGRLVLDKFEPHTVISVVATTRLSHVIVLATIDRCTYSRCGFCYVDPIDPDQCPDLHPELYPNRLILTETTGLGFRTRCACGWASADTGYGDDAEAAALRLGAEHQPECEKPDARFVIPRPT